MCMIPKIIHQVWSEKYKPLPSFFQTLAQTWKDMYPDWEYIYWDEKKMDDYIREEYHQYYDFYYQLPFDAQRWDMIRFLILDKMGGMHVDFDYESLENMESLLEGKTCSIGLEPDVHCKSYGLKHVLNSALIASVPAHPFIKKVIERIYSGGTLNYSQKSKSSCVLNTTGPLFLSNLYLSLPPVEKNQIYLIPARHVSPFSYDQTRQVGGGVINEELEDCLKEAYAVHYFANSWIPILGIHA